ncbi:MAG: serine hydrolase [Clostridia bacterium]|nr:serine hydrolase [Clostridia bacterium]
MKTKLSSEWIYKFYQELEKNGVENHALLIEQGGEILFEEYAAPYSADMPHTLFSVTKSIVSTAVGFAIEEGLFTLDSRILPFFIEYMPCESDEWNNVSVRSLITMKSNKQFSFTQDMTDDYVDIFMKAPFRKKDRGFLYSNNDVHVAAALIQKLTGMSLADYLMPRLFEPLGIEKPQWETDARGDCIGGTGAYLTARDLAKICRCYANGGVYNGKQVIPESWTREATKLQVPLSGRENEDGYGYLFWTQNDTFSMNGMFGQIVTYFPKYDAVVVSLNCIVGDSVHNSLIRNTLTKAFENPSCSEWDEKLAEYLAGRGMKPIVCEALPEIPTGKAFYLTPACDAVAKLVFPVSLIPRSLTCSFATRPKENLNRLSFEKTDDVLTVRWFEEGDEVVINCGLDGEARLSECSIKGYKYVIWAYAYIENGVLKAVVKPLNTLATQYLTFGFAENEVQIQFKGTPSFTEFIGKNATESSIVKNSGIFRGAMEKTVRVMLEALENPLIFKAK